MSLEDGDDFVDREFKLLQEKIMLRLDEPKCYDRDKMQKTLEILCDILKESEHKTILVLRQIGHRRQESRKLNIVM